MTKAILIGVEETGSELSRRAAALLLELQAIQECCATGNTVGGFRLLEIALADAEALAKQATREAQALKLARAQADEATRRPHGWLLDLCVDKVA